jgi:hypothetical protein
MLSRHECLLPLNSGEWSWKRVENIFREIKTWSRYGYSTFARDYNRGFPKKGRPQDLLAARDLLQNTKPLR